MATQTTNLELVKPTYAEPTDIAVINGNMDIIDGVVGGTSMGTTATTLTGAIAEHEGDISGINAELGKVEDSIAIIVNGKQSAVAASIGKYVFLKNSTITGVTDGLYTAAKAISANTDIDDTYLTAVSNGGLNALNNSIINKLAKSFSVASTGTTFNVESNGRMILDFMSSAAGSCGSATCYVGNDGTPYINKTTGISNLTFGTSTANKLTISGSNCTMYVRIYAGDITT